MIMIINEITDMDIVEVSDVLVSAYKDEPWNENWTRERAMIRIKAILYNYQAIGLKANDEEGIVGAILGFVDPYSNEDFFYVSELFVKSERKGQGIGTALLNALDKYLKVSNIQVMQLTSIQDNLKFYKQNGLKKDIVDVLYKKIN